MPTRVVRYVVYSIRSTIRVINVCCGLRKPARAFPLSGGRIRETEGAELTEYDSTVAELGNPPDINFEKRSGELRKSVARGALV